MTEKRWEYYPEDLVAVTYAAQHAHACGFEVAKRLRGWHGAALRRGDPWAAEQIAGYALRVWGVPLATAVPA